MEHVSLTPQGSGLLCKVEAIVTGKRLKIKFCGFLRSANCFNYIVLAYTIYQVKETSLPVPRKVTNGSCADII